MKFAEGWVCRFSAVESNLESVVRYRESIAIMDKVRIKLKRLVASPNVETRAVNPRVFDPPLPCAFSWLVLPGHVTTAREVEGGYEFTRDGRVFHAKYQDAELLSPNPSV